MYGEDVYDHRKYPTGWRRWVLILRQKLCRHRDTRVSGGYDQSETVCNDCGLRHGVLGKHYGSDWRYD